MDLLRDRLSFADEGESHSSSSSTVFQSFTSEEEEGMEGSGGEETCAMEGYQILITVDKAKRTLRLTDMGIGMTKDDLVSRLALFDKSSVEFSEDAAKISQVDAFGIGCVLWRKARFGASFCDKLDFRGEQARVG
jgi:hypothetical protein